jgi:hypothetical protein
MPYTSSKKLHSFYSRAERAFREADVSAEEERDALLNGIGDKTTVLVVTENGNMCVFGDNSLVSWVLGTAMT